MTDFYGIEPDTIPAFVGLGDQYEPVEVVPEGTRVFMGAMVEHLRNLHTENPLGFESVIRFVAAAISEQP